MNISGDLIAFFTLKNRRTKKGNKFESLPDSDDETESLKPTEETESYKTFEPTINHFLGVYLSIIVLVSVVANLLVILVIFFRKRKFKSTHIFIVALAISDTLFSVAIHPMLIATSFGVSPHELFGVSGCNWYGFGAVFFGGLSMCIHGTVAFTRYHIIVHSGNEYWHETKHNLNLLIGNVVAAAFIALCPILGWGRYETFEYGCTLAFHDPSFNLRSYVFFCLATIFMTPLCVCCYCYGKIINFTYQCKLELFGVGQEDLTAMNIGMDPIQGGFDQEEQKKLDGLMRQVDPNLLEAMALVERKFTRLTLVAASGFMMAWLPFCLLCMWELATPPDEIPTTFRVVACLFCKSATAYNPFIYFFMGKEFRNDCRNVVLSCFSNICPRSSNQVIGATDGIYVGNSSSRMDKSSEFGKATRRRQGNGKKFNRVSITENPFLTMDDEPLRKNDGMSMENRLVQKDKYSSLEDMAMQETVFATADDLDVYKDTLIL